MRTDIKLYKVIIYGWLIIDAVLSIMGGTGDFSDYYSIVGLVALSILDAIRLLWKRKHK